MTLPPVKECMTPYLITVTPDTVLPDAHYLMTKNRIRHLPVVKDGDLVGIVTLTDILEAEPSEAVALKVWERQHLLNKLEVRKTMTLRPFTIAAEASIGEAAEIMLDKKVGCLPVVDGAKKLIGLITESDIFRFVACTWREEKRRQSSADIAGQGLPTG